VKHPRGTLHCSSCLLTDDSTAENEAGTRRTQDRWCFREPVIWTFSHSAKSGQLLEAATLHFLQRASYLDYSLSSPKTEGCIGAEGGPCSR